MNDEHSKQGARASRAFESSAAAYYSGKLREHGATPAGVDWNSAGSQQLRFEQLLKICGPGEDYSLIDFGCGYGALLAILKERGVAPRYCGYDIAEAMVLQARQLHGTSERHCFTSRLDEISVADYTVASGIFNVKQDARAEDWEVYILDTLHRIAALSGRGFAFNMLTSYADPDKMRDSLYYGDPCFFFDYCKKNFSRQVALLHDYGLYEFTVLVRKT